MSEHDDYRNEALPICEICSEEIGWVGAEASPLNAELHAACDDIHIARRAGTAAIRAFSLGRRAATCGDPIAAMQRDDERRANTAWYQGFYAADRDCGSAWPENKYRGLAIAMGMTNA